MKKDNKKVFLFYPHLTQSAKDAARRQMDTRWIGQGPLVDEFELMFEKQISHKHKAIAVNSCTSALHLAYILAGIKDDDEVIGSVFTCSATYVGLLYQRAKVIFADINRDNMNIDPYHVEMLINERGEKVKAIVVVHFGGYLVDMDKIHNIARKWTTTIALTFSPLSFISISTWYGSMFILSLLISAKITFARWYRSPTYVAEQVKTEPITSSSSLMPARI